MTLATLDAPGPAPIWKGSPSESAHHDLMPELTEAQWAHIQARLRATGLPVEVEDDRALARTFGVSALFGLGLASLAACGLWGLLT